MQVRSKLMAQVMIMRLRDYAEWLLEEKSKFESSEEESEEEEDAEFNQDWVLMNELDNLV